MKIRERLNLAAGILFTLILGTLLHFTYHWSGENPFVALFSPVNESVWEHLKLLFFPVLLYTFFEIIVLYKGSGHFLTSRLLAVCMGMFFIVSSFFTYTGLFGQDFFVLDILIFVFSVLLTFLLSRYLEGIIPHAPDGVHSPASADNVRWLQQAAGLPRTGTLDRATWDVLSRLYEVFVVREMEKNSGFSGGWG